MADNITKPLFWAEMFMDEFGDEENSSLWGGSIPRDTGRTQDNSIFLRGSNEETATIVIGGGEPPDDDRIFHPKNDPPLSWYAGELEEAELTSFGNPNKHKGFIEKFIGNEFMAALSAHGIEVIKIEIEGEKEDDVQ